MEKRRIHILTFLLLITILAGCSTKKNTWTRRNFHSMTTRFNVAFNGNESYKEGVKSIETANQDDYSEIIPMYPISHHDNAKSATSKMDRAIEKSRKAIKIHSIKKKPKRDEKNWSKPEYQAFYNQNEFNPALKDAWMLIGKSEFNKGDFLGSVGTFSYIARYYATDKDIVAQCQLWTVWAYVEMDWIYEAEELLGKINEDDLKYANMGLWASTNAVLLLKKGQHKEAIPYVELTLKREKSKYLKQRFNYLLAQLYQKTNDKKSAIKAYTNVIKMNPPYVMDFNARINRAQLQSGNNLASVLKELRKMAKNPNNKEYLDQIYYAKGNAHITNGDTVKAIENYNLSVEKSTRNGVEKAVTLITLGDLYYSKKEYVKAEPSYSEASKIITNEHKDYKRVLKLSEDLGELTKQHQIVVLQDSLQYLATLPQEEQLRIVNRIIENLVAEEKAAEEKAKELETKGTDERFVPIGGPGATSGKWYFYNTNTLRLGKAEFQKKWGNRKLEDNWRRTTKSTGMFGSDTMIDEPTATAEGTPEGDGTEGSAASAKTEATDNKKPEFYLQQIPKSKEQINKSNEQIADALFEMGNIYKDKINDLPMAIETYNDFIKRFGTEKRVPDAYFQLYLSETKNNNESGANVYRSKILTDYASTQYAQMLSQPDYIERFLMMQKQQDSLYQSTYEAYSKNEFGKVKMNVEYARANYSMSKLMPKFMFLEALTIGKTDTPANFEKALNKLIEIYPQSDVSAMAKDIAALIRQGNEAQAGGSHGTLLAKREEELKTELNEKAEKGEIGARSYTAEKQSKHRLMLISSAEQQDMYQLMYQVAAYNFTRFMIKEFDLALTKLDEKRHVLSITNFESYDEVNWYINSINADITVGGLINKLKIEEVVISEDNFNLLRVLGFDEYLAFANQNLKGKGPTIANTTPKQKPQEPSKPTVVTPKPEPQKPQPTTPKPQVVTTKPEEKPKPEEVKPTVPTEEPKKEEPKKPVEPEVKPEPTIPVEPEVKPEPVTPTPEVKPVEPEEEKVPLYKGLFGYQPEKPHFVALYVISGKGDFEKLKADFTKYNAENYGMLNLNISVEEIGAQQVVIIGSFADAEIAKSYLLRMVKEKVAAEGLKGTNFRNLLGTQKNLNVMMQNNALKTYTEFMQEYYFK